MTRSEAPGPEFSGARLPMSLAYPLPDQRV